MLLIGGDAGMGKTRLTEELASRAGERGIVTHVGRSWDGGGPPPFWPWTEVFRSLAAERGHHCIDEAAGASAGELHPIVPERSPNAAPRPTEVLDGAERFRTLDTASEVLHRLARQQPFVVVLDDLHWSDGPTADLLRFVARRAASAPLLVIGTFRQTDLDAGTPMAAAVPRIAQERHVRRLELRGFTLDEIGQLLAAGAGLDTDVPSRERELELFERTAGNPFLLRELILSGDAAGATGTDRSTPSPDDLPALAHRVLTARIDRLSPPARTLLQAASVIGLHFPVPLATDAAGLEAADGWRALDEATRSGLAVSPPPGTDEARLAHALLRDVLYESCGSGVRDIHHAVARSLEASARTSDRPVDAIELHSAELAWHFARAGLPADDPRVLEYSVQAGHAALRRHDEEAALRLFTEATSALDAMDAPPLGLRHEATLGVAVSSRQSGASDPSEWFGAALELARQLDDPERVARTAIAMSEPGVYDHRRVAALRMALDGLAGEHDHAAPGDGPDDAARDSRRLRSLVAGRLSEEVAPVDPAEGIALANSAVELARALEDPLIVGRALNAQRLANWRADRADEQMAIGTEMLELADTSEEPILAVDARRTLLVAHQQLGRLPDASRDAAALEQLSLALHDPIGLGYVHLARAMITLAQGRLLDTERHIREVTGVAERLGHEALGQFALAQGMLLRWERGEDVVLGESVLDLPDGHELLAVWRCGLTFTACQPGREEGLQARFRGLAPSSFADAPHTFTWLACVALLAAIADFLDAIDEAPLLAELLDPFAPYAVTIGPAVCLGSASYFAGLAWRTAGQFDRAHAALQRAITDNDRMGARPWAARSRVALALLVEGSDAVSARSLMLEAHDIAEALTLPRLLDECGRALAGARPALPDGLTPREAEILRGLASGMTNAELADALFVSVKTVERHVASLYRKIGVRNRAEATAYARRKDLA